MFIARHSGLITRVVIPQSHASCARTANTLTKHPQHRLVRKNRHHTHEAFPKHRLVRKNRQHTHEADLLISQRPIC